MQKNLKTDIFAFVAAACFVISAIRLGVISIIYIALAAFLILSTSVIREKCGIPIKKNVRDLGFTIAGGIFVLLELFKLFYSFSYYPFYYLLNFLSVAILFLLILKNYMPTLLEHTPTLAKAVDIIYKVWFIPAILQVINCFYSNISLNFHVFVIAIAFFFMALWLRSPDKIGDEAYTDLSKQNRQSFQTASFNGGADQLKFYKDLLDSGAISQEEFDAKKKEIIEKILN